MSDPVTNAEVEDVLSSIRRLVSEDKRPLQTKTRPVVSDRLVLTPALRVAEPDVETPDKADDAMAQDWSEEDAAFEAAYGEDASDETSVGTGPAPDTAAGDEALSAAPDVAGDPGSGDFETDLDDPALDYETDPYNFADDADQDGEGGRDGYAFDDAFQDADEDEAVAPGPDADDDATPARHDAQAATLSAKIEALETAIGNISETWEPDSPGDGEYSGTEAPAMAWEDDVEQTVSTARLHNLPKTGANSRIPPASSVTGARKIRPKPTSLMRWKMPRRQNPTNALCLPKMISCWTRKRCAIWSARSCGPNCKAHWGNGSPAMCASWCGVKSTAP